MLNEGDATRIIHGERAGSWISDQMALTADNEIVSKVLQPSTLPPSDADAKPQRASVSSERAEREDLPD